MLYLLVHQQSLLWLKLVYNKDSQNIAFSFQVCATYPVAFQSIVVNTFYIVSFPLEYPTSKISINFTHKKHSSNLKQLENVIKTVSTCEITFENCCKLIESMPQRLKTFYW